MSKTAIVTGGSRGLGAAIAKRLAKLGYNLVLDYVSDTSKKLAQNIIDDSHEKYGIAGFTIQADTSDYENDKWIVNSTIEKFGRIDVLVNNAGITNGKLFNEVTPEEYTRLINVNLLGYMHMIHNVLPYMLKQQSGKIINISAIAGSTGLPMLVDYGASKGGIDALSRNLALELADKGITVNSIAPGMVKTDIVSLASPEQQKAMESAIPVKKMGDPEDIADAAEYIVTASNFLTGQKISPNGGAYLP